MRAAFSVFAVLFAGVPAVSAAATPFAEPQAMVYFQSHWSGRAQDTQSSLGLRFDRSAVVDKGVSDFQRQVELPAALEFRVGRDGMQALTVGGTDFLSWYRVHHAEETSGSQASDQKPAAEGQAAAPGAKEAPQETKAPEEKKLTIGGILDAAPVGVIMGVGLGIFLLTGSDN